MQGACDQAFMRQLYTYSPAGQQYEWHLPCCPPAVQIWDSTWRCMLCDMAMRCMQNLGGAAGAGSGADFPQDLSSMLQGNPMVQNLLSDPEVLRTMFESNPQLRQVRLQAPAVCSDSLSTSSAHKCKDCAALQTLLQQHLNTEQPLI